jgi:hypothetical protein
MWQLSESARAYREERVRVIANTHARKHSQRDATEYEISMVAFNAVPFGHAFSHQFLIELWTIMWPDFFMLNKDGIENDWCIRMAKAFRQHKMISLIGCASSSKSQCAAFYAYTLWKANPSRTTAMLSTTSAESGEARMWGYIKDLFTKDRFPIGKRIDSLQTIILDKEVKDDDGVKQRDFKDCLKFVKLKTGREGLNAVGTMCGRKNDFVLWACDEENFMDIGILPGRVNMFSNAKPGSLVQFIGIGNAPNEGSPLYIDAEPTGAKFPDGYRSVNIEVDEEWPTRTGVCLYFNGNKSPNFRALDQKKPPFPFLMNAFSKAEIRNAAMGEETNIFWSQFYGFPPSVEVPDKVLTHKLLESNGAFEKCEWGGSPTKWLGGLDCGFRKDGDPTVLDFARIGKDVKGNTVMDWESKDGMAILPVQNSKDAFEKQMAIRVIDKLIKKDCHDLAIDIMGEGGMTATAIKDEALKRGWKLNLVPISSMGSPDDKIVVPGDKRMASEVFDRKVSQIWMSMRVAVGKGLIRGMGPHTKAVQQLCERKFITDQRKRFAIEKKEDMKKRLRRSPDFGDSRCYTLFLGLSHGLALAPKAQAVVLPPTREERDASGGNRYSGHGISGNRYAGR